MMKAYLRCTLAVICLLALPLTAHAKLILDGTTDTLAVVTASAVTTMHVHVSWVDMTTTAMTPGSDGILITLAATTTVVPAPAASTQRQVKLVTVYNAHASSSNAVSIQHFDGVDTVVLMKYTVLAGETLQWSEDENFRVIDALGQIKAVVAADTELPASVALADAVANPTAPGVGAFLMCWNGTTWDRCPPNVAHDAVATSQNPVTMGGYASAAAPADVSLDGDAVRGWHLRNGAQANQPTFSGILQSTGNGIAGTGTPRVTIASDNTAFTTNVGTFPDNEPFNVAQINGVTPLMGTGLTGTGALRVTESTDSQISAGVGGTGEGAATVGSTGSLNAKQRLMTSQLDTISTALQLIDNDQTGASVHYRTSVGTTEDEHEVKATAGRLFSITATNTNAAARYLRCSNLTAVNTTPGTSTVLLGLAIPGATAGAGFTVQFGGTKGVAFGTALTCWLVTGAADTDVVEVAANEIKVIYAYE